jgi:hypothetical protein
MICFSVVIPTMNSPTLKCTLAVRRFKTRPMPLWEILQRGLRWIQAQLYSRADLTVCTAGQFINYEGPS